MPQSRPTRLYESRLTLSCPGDRVMIHRDGDRLIIEPVRRKNLLEVLAGLEPLDPDDQFPDVDDTLLPVKAIDL